MWMLLAKVKWLNGGSGYKLYLLLCPDPNGPLAGLLMPLMNTRLEVAHMDNLKTIMERFNDH